jgi:hypothetical protein
MAGMEHRNKFSAFQKRRKISRLDEQFSSSCSKALLHEVFGQTLWLFGAEL